MIKQKRGITFLLAIIISSLALSLGLGIAFVLMEELKLSSSNKDSFIAFFAADSGMDCALYWDLKRNFFSTTTANTIICNNQSFGVGGAPSSQFLLGLGNNCSKVTVSKIGVRTIITALGQNISCGAASGPRTVQRGIEVTY